jgi:hypothetical protein
MTEQVDFFKKINPYGTLSEDSSMTPLSPSTLSPSSGSQGRRSFDEYLRVDKDFGNIGQGSKIPKRHLPVKNWQSSIQQCKQGKKPDGKFYTKDEAFRYIFTKYMPNFVKNEAI